jgi:hypothetical protein
MAEPTTTAGAAGAAWWPWVAGLLAAFFAAIGVTWEAVFWASAGAFFGAGLGPRTGRWRAAVGFPLSVLLAAKAGTIWAAWGGPAGALMEASRAAEAAAALFGLLFHPAVAALVRLAPVLVRLRLGVQDPKDAS